MAISREPLYAALADRLKTAVPLVTVTRKFRPVLAVPASEQPLLVVLEHEEQPTQRMGLPPVWNVRPGLIVYARLDDPDDNPSQIINPILDQVEAALEATPDEHAVHLEAFATTLGTLVTYCRQDGPTVIERGDQGKQLVAYIPLDMLVAG